MAVNSLTCRFGGTSSYEYAPETDVTTISALAGVYADPGCHDALYQVEVVLSYESPAGSGRLLTSRARGVNAMEDPDHQADWAVQTSVQVPGPTGPIEVSHVASFLCNSQGRPFLCTGTATTNPK